jgi:hypothetical protein
MEFIIALKENAMKFKLQGVFTILIMSIGFSSVQAQTLKTYMRSIDSLNSIEKGSYSSTGGAQEGGITPLPNGV